VPRKLKSGKIKLKTHKATSKRFGITGSGKIVRTKGGKAHLRRKRSARVKALFGEMVPVKGKSYTKKIRRLAPTMKP
jgi:large subunit ribosomal protein L35